MGDWVRGGVRGWGEGVGRRKGMGEGWGREGGGWGGVGVGLGGVGRGWGKGIFKLQAKAGIRVF